MRIFVLIFISFLFLTPALIGIQFGKYTERERLREMREKMERAWIQPCDFNKERGKK